MHWQVHRTDVVPELAGRRGMTLVARSKGEKISQLYASRQSHVVKTRSPRAVVEEWSRQSPSTKAVETVPSTRVVGTVPEHKKRGKKPYASSAWR